MSRHAFPERRALKPPHAADALNCLILSWPQVPIDGVVEWGSCLVNEAMITGESELLPRRPGDRVIGGTINQVCGLCIVAGSGRSAYTMVGVVRRVASYGNRRTRVESCEYRQRPPRHLLRASLLRCMFSALLSLISCCPV
jgi:magnesium-transporting ATPase (P-type)